MVQFKLNTEVSALRRLGTIVIVLSLCCLFNLATATASDRDAKQTELDGQQFAAELKRLAEICDKLGLTEQADTCRNWLAPPRGDLHRLYLPLNPPATAGRKELDQWRNRFVTARKRHAKYLFEMARQACDANQEASAYRLLWNVMREDPDHEDARRILGPLATQLNARPQARTAGKSHELSGLGAVSRWQTPHFDLYTRENAKSSLALMQRLEQFYILWTQAFYELWAPENLLKRRFAGENAPWPNHDRLRVAMLADRDEYLKLLNSSEENIGVSVGYYNPEHKLSVFYRADDLYDTLHHELTHQLFSEASSLKPAQSLDKVQGAWCIEGLALYMESLTEDKAGWSVGGLDAPRLQAARYRALRDQFWPAWNSWCEGSLDSWKSSPDISVLYSHAAGLTHLLLDLIPNRQQARSAFFDYIKAVYSGRQQASTVLQLLGTDEQTAQANYRLWMTITQEQLNTLTQSPDRVRQLVLCRSQIEDWSPLERLPQLNWLDLTLCNFKSADANFLRGMIELKRLSVESTEIDNQAMPIFASLSALNDLDLSQCAIDDQGLQAITRHANIETLWLTGCKISERSLPTLISLPKLHRCEIQGSLIPPKVWEEFIASHPRLGRAK